MLMNSNVWILLSVSFLSKFNNNHNPHNKTTKTVAGLGLSKCLETTINRPTIHHHHTNSKLYERVRNWGLLRKKSQNCVKAAIAFVCTTCKRQLLFALLQLITFVWTNAIANILITTPIVNFCMPYCNCQRFYGTTTFVWLLQPLQGYWLLNAQW